MQPLSKATSAILDALVEGLGEFGSRKIDNTSGSYLPVNVQHIGPNRFSVSHYVEQNGDLCADPDMEFLFLHGKWYPAACQQWDRYSRAIETDGNGEIKGYRPRCYRDLRSFARLFLDNIRHQQGIKPKRPPRTPTKKAPAGGPGESLDQYTALGRAAFEAGKTCVAWSDPDLKRKLYGNRRVEVGDGLPAMTAWVEGWTAAQRQATSTAGGAS